MKKVLIAVTFNRETAEALAEGDEWAMIYEIMGAYFVFSYARIVLRVAVERITRA
jgi:hypothetical protein